MANDSSNPEEPNWDHSIVISWNPEISRLVATAVTDKEEITYIFSEGRRITDFAEIKRRLGIGESNG